MIKKIDVTEIKGFKLGNAENIEAGTGCTVIINEDGAVAGVDVRGGAPATRELDLLQSDKTVQKINAVMLSGGSAYGLEAGSGVMRFLENKNVGFAMGDITVPIVCQASLFDLGVGDPSVRPDVAMGIEACENAYNGVFEHGNHGAGTGASVGKYYGMSRAMKTGLGTYACSDGLCEVGAITAVNAFADVFDGGNRMIAGLLSPDLESIQGTINCLKNAISKEPAPVVEIESDDPADILRDRLEVIKEQLSHKITIDTTAFEKLIDDSIGEIIIDKSATSQEAAKESSDMEEAAVTEIVEEAVTEEPTVDDIVEEAVTEDPAVTEVVDEVVAEPESIEEESQLNISADDPDFDELTLLINKIKNGTDVEIPEESPRELTYEDMGYDHTFNTTICCLITNAKLSKADCNRLASILHDGYARAIKPVHTSVDGDTIFVMTTNEVDVNFDAFAALATDIVQYSIIDGVLSARDAYGLRSASYYKRRKL